MNSRNYFALLIALGCCLIAISPASAQSPASAPTNADLQERIRNWKRKWPRCAANSSA